jgi:hypothetical protein
MKKFKGRTERKMAIGQVVLVMVVESLLEGRIGTDLQFDLLFQHHNNKKLCDWSARCRADKPKQ